MNHFHHNHTADLSTSLTCNSSITSASSRLPGSDDAMPLAIAGEVEALVQRLLRREQFETVVSVVSDLIDDHPDSLFLHFALGTAYSNLGRASEAIMHCQRFIDIPGDEATATFKAENLLAVENNLALALVTPLETDNDSIGDGHTHSGSRDAQRP